METPTQLSYRKTTRDVDLAGYAIPAGKKLAVWFSSANRDSRRWPEPDKYDINRNLIGHMAFGDGPHVCLGQNIARLEADCILSTLAKRYRKIELNGEARHKLVNSFRGLEQLPLKLVRA